jgi:hypothetical protein
LKNLFPLIGILIFVVVSFEKEKRSFRLILVVKILSNSAVVNKEMPLFGGNGMPWPPLSKTAASSLISRVPVIGYRCCHDLLSYNYQLSRSQTWHRRFYMGF